MKRIIYIILGFIIGLTTTAVYAAPPYTLMRTILPESGNLYDLGSNTDIWRNLYANSISTLGLNATNGFFSTILTGNLTSLGGVTSTAMDTNSITSNNICLSGVCNSVWPDAFSTTSADFWYTTAPAKNPFNQTLNTDSLPTFAVVDTSRLDVLNTNYSSQIRLGNVVLTSTAQILYSFGSSSLSFGNASNYDFDNRLNVTGPGTSSPVVVVDDKGTATSTLQIGDAGRPGCIKMMSTDLLTWVYLLFEPDGTPIITTDNTVCGM